MPLKFDSLDLIMMFIEDLLKRFKSKLFSKLGPGTKESKFLSRKFGIFISPGCEFIGIESMRFGDGVSIGTISFFAADMGKISVGANTGFNRNVHINASVGGEISIGADCLIGPNVVMRTAGHRFEDLELPIRKQGHILKDITINDNVWIGSNAVILGGVVIGEGAVIGAGAVVTKDVPPFAVVGGVPARILKYRK